jgi:hypothetical protein
VRSAIAGSLRVSGWVCRNTPQASKHMAAGTGGISCACAYGVHGMCSVRQAGCLAQRCCPAAAAAAAWCFDGSWQRYPCMCVFPFASCIYLCSTAVQIAYRRHGRCRLSAWLLLAYCVDTSNCGHEPACCRTLCAAQSIVLASTIHRSGGSLLAHHVTDGDDLLPQHLQIPAQI